MPIHLSMSELGYLALESPFLDKIEEALRAGGKNETADDLQALQRDAGLDYARSFGHFEDFAPGPQTAKILKAYEEVTQERVNGTLADSYSAYSILREHPLLDEFKAVIDKVSALQPKPSKGPDGLTKEQRDRRNDQMTW
jgi:hypothetical protein